MNIIVNGEERSLVGSETVEQLIEILGLDGQKVAVERNMEIVPKSQYKNLVFVALVPLCDILLVYTFTKIVGKCHYTKLRVHFSNLF